MAMTKAQKDACLKYQRTLKQISVKIKPEELEKYKKAAQKDGMSFRSWVIKAMDKAIGGIHDEVRKSNKS